MSLQITEATQEELPEGATHGFKLSQGEETLFFFHWHEDGQVPILTAKIVGDESRLVESGSRPTTAYADVLAALPDRLAAMGYEHEIDAVLGEVWGRYGR